MDIFTITIVCSIYSYNEIMNSLRNSHFDLPDKNFVIDDKGYIYYELNQNDIDAIMGEHLTFLSEKVSKLNESGEYAVMSQIDN